MHAIGDRAAREALDAFAAAARPDLRHHVAHLQVVHPDDVPRFAPLGVAANMQALWACLDEQMVDLTLPFLGEERATVAVPVRRPAPGRRAAGGGQRLAGDHARPARRHPHRRQPHDVRRGRPRPGSEPFLPEQAISLETAFAAYTSGSAWVNHRDDAGVLAPGAVADLVVLDRDPFAGPPEQVGATRVVLDVGRRSAGLRSLRRPKRRNHPSRRGPGLQIPHPVARLGSPQVDPGRAAPWLTRRSATSSTASSSTRRRGRPTT